MIAIDSETCLFRAGCMAPPLVCVTWADERTSGILHWQESEGPLLQWLRGTDEIVGQNFAYDACVFMAQFPDLTPTLFQAYQDDRVTDTKIRQQLLDIAAGYYRAGPDSNGVWRKRGYSLADLARRFLGKTLDKDTWRTGYAALRDLPLSEWPQGAIDYAVDDARTTLDIALLQEAHKDFLKDQFRQTRAALALALSSNWGLRTDPKAVEEFASLVEADYDEVKAKLRDTGILRVNGSRDTKVAKDFMIRACATQGLEPRLTATGAICMDREACEVMEDEVIRDYSHFLTLGKVLSTDVAMLRSATVLPVHPRYDLAESGRTTCSKPNIQNVSRRKGSREPYTPRPGKLFAQADYGGLELATLAQVCMTLFGHSKLADALNAGRDPHTEVAAQLAKLPYEEVKARVKTDPALGHLRQLAKALNFGLPGGLGAKTFIKFAKKSAGLDITEERFYELKQIWMYTWPEVQELFQWAGEKTAQDKPVVEQLFVGRFRGGCTYSSMLNSTFQGLGADCAKEAAWLITRACYLADEASVLYGSRMVAMVHDEYILEVDDDDLAHEKALELERLMIRGAKKYLPDVCISAPPTLQRCWSKDAEAVYVDGRLVPWERKA
jgi:DNA polymerase I-like protein with 3'-5' exonuclease and polymerase domains